jgi:hypothetical protein
LKIGGLKVLQKGLCIAALLFCAAQASFATIITFSGNLATDDDLVTFYYTVQSAGPVNIYTTSFAQETGFAPIITVFDSLGDLVNSNDGSTTNPGSCGIRGTDPGTGLCWDAVVSWGSDANVQYSVVLSQWGNDALGSTLAAGFRETEDTFNSPNYTGQPPWSVLGGSFRLPDGQTQRTSAYTIVFEADDAQGLTVIPEPASGLLLLGGVALVAWKKTRKKS